jgi:hypothetical protein
VTNECARANTCHTQVLAHSHSLSKFSLGPPPPPHLAPFSFALSPSRPLALSPSRARSCSLASRSLAPSLTFSYPASLLSLAQVHIQMHNTHIHLTGLEGLLGCGGGQGGAPGQDTDAELLRTQALLQPSAAGVAGGWAQHWR